MGNATQKSKSWIINKTKGNKSGTDRQSEIITEMNLQQLISSWLNISLKQNQTKVDFWIEDTMMVGQYTWWRGQRNDWA